MKKGLILLGACAAVSVLSSSAYAWKCTASSAYTHTDGKRYHWKGWSTNNDKSLANQNALQECAKRTHQGQVCRTQSCISTDGAGEAGHGITRTSKDVGKQGSDALKDAAKDLGKANPFKTW